MEAFINIENPGGHCWEKDVYKQSRVEYIEYEITYMPSTSDNTGALEIPLIWADGVHQYLDGNWWEFTRAFWEKNWQMKSEECLG